ncbi:MAG: energy-coupling factor transporter transmembrane component T, partial [Candidatus Omnitrophica bacterium]|nr:energy-coupling factor transporter transmembrane component T [Candidatus Omnitrophota bacterium]
MCYRYIYLFVEMIENMYMGMKSRIGRALPAQKGQQIVTWSIASLWQRSYQLNNQVYAAMLSRGYRGEPQELDEYKTRTLDWVWLFFSLLILILLLSVTYAVK